MTESEMFRLQPGNKIKLSPNSDNYIWQKDHVVTVDNPPTATFLGRKMVRYTIYVNEELSLSSMDYPENITLAESGVAGTHACMCERFTVVNYGCKCGGV